MKKLIEYYKNNPWGVVALVFAIGLIVLTALSGGPGTLPAYIIFSASIVLNLVGSYIQSRK